jgi:hypothetical protein
MFLIPLSSSAASSSKVIVAPFHHLSAHSVMNHSDSETIMIEESSAEDEATPTRPSSKHEKS